MLDHENLNKNKNRNAYIDDTNAFSRKMSLDDNDNRNVIPERSKEMYDGKQKHYRQKWQEKLKKLENDAAIREKEKSIEEEKNRHISSHAEGGHQTQLSRILQPVEQMMGAERQLITVPQNTVLLNNLGRQFEEKLSGANRDKKKKVKKHELNQKEKNAFMLEVAGENYAKGCFSALTEAMKNRTITFDDRKDLRDLAQFVGSKDQSFTAEDKKLLLDSYLGKGNEEGPEGLYGKDRQLAMDLMTKALLAIDIDSISIDSEAIIAKNAEKFESLAGMVAAYDSQLKKYNDAAKSGGGENAGYLESLDDDLRTKVSQHLSKLRNVAYFYVTAKDVMRNKYYKTHLNSEMADMAQENDSRDQKVLATAIKTYKNRVDDFKKQDFPEITEQQSEKLQSNLEGLKYFSEESVKEGITSNALRSNQTFQGLFMSFDRLNENGRYFGANSFRMKIVKKHIKDIRGILNKTAGSFNEYPRDELIKQLSQLNRACSDYDEGRKKKRVITDRHQSVRDIMKSSRQCLDLVLAMTDDQYKKLTTNKQEKPLREIFEGSDMVVKENRREKEDTKREYLRKQHYNMLPGVAAKVARDISKLRSFDHRFDGLNAMMKTFVQNDEKSFNTTKMDFVKNYEDFLLYCDRYTKDYSPSFQSGRTRFDNVREMADYAKNMLDMIKSIRYSDVKSKNVTNIKWVDLIFGYETVSVTAKELQEDSRTVFKDDKKDMEMYKYGKALDFIIGDTSMYTNYKQTVLTQDDGTKKTGLSYKKPENELEDSHENQTFRLVTAEEISKAADEGNMSVIYSENALRQLSTIRIMDTLFGRQTRNSKTISYTAASQMVYGEPRIVIRSVDIKDYNYFSEQEQIEGGREININVLDNNGKLKMGAYDRKVADRIMSLTAEKCLEEFGAQGIKISDDEKQAFTNRFNALKAAFEMDATSEDGWRYNQDEEDEETVAQDIKEKRATVKKYKRWGLKDDSDEIKELKREIMNLQEKKVRDMPGMYNDNLYKKIEKNEDLGLVEESLLPKYKELEENINLEGENAIKEEEINLQDEEKAKKLRTDKAKKKIQKIREMKKKYQARSEKNRVSAKTNAKDFIEQKMQNKPDGLSEEFLEILRLFDDYFKYDVSTLKCLKNAVEEGNKLFVDYSDYLSEGESLKKAVDAATIRFKLLKPIKKDQLSPAQSFEFTILNYLMNKFYNLTKGSLKKFSGVTNMKVGDDSFCEIEVDENTNKIKSKNKSKMTDYSNVPLFTHEPTVEDIVQGDVGDCYLLSTLASIVETNPQFIKEMLHENDDHTVTVRFYDDKGKMMYVTVNKTVPKDLKADKKGKIKDRYARGALWVKMIEKAFVASGLAVYANKMESKNASGKMKDKLDVINKLKEENLVSYSSIGSGNATDFSRFITNVKGVADSFHTKQTFESQMGKKKEMILNKEQTTFKQALHDMQNNPNAKFSLVAASPGSHDAGDGTGLEYDMAAGGVLNRHGYTVMGYEEVDGEEIVVLRNPWGHAGEDEYYDEKTGAISTKIVEDMEQGGYLFLPIDKFFSLFNSYHIIKTQ